MNYFDPARPMLGNGNPMYCDGKGAGIAALPDIAFSMIPEGALIARVMLKTGSSTFSWFHTEIKVGEVEGMLRDYVSDPEKVLTERFGYRGVEGEEVATASAEELGL